MTLLIIDENVPRKTVALLREAGLELVCISEVSPGASDRAVIEYANREAGVIVSFDKDFG